MNARSVASFFPDLWKIKKKRRPYKRIFKAHAQVCRLKDFLSIGLSFSCNVTVF